MYKVHSDYLGTPRVVTDSTNTPVWKWLNLNAYGSNLPSLENITYNLRFAGQYFDNKSKLHYNYYRTYNPETGRYMQSDPIGLAAGANTYNYVGGNPLNGVDPLGLSRTGATLDMVLFPKNSIQEKAARSPLLPLSILVRYPNIYTVGAHMNTNVIEDSRPCPPEQGMHHCNKRKIYYGEQGINDFIDYLYKNNYQKGQALFLVGCNSGGITLDKNGKKLLPIASTIAKKINSDVIGVIPEAIYSYSSDPHKNRIQAHKEAPTGSYAIYHPDGTYTIMD